MEEDEYITVTEAAQLLGYIRTSVYALIDTGKLASKKLGPHAVLVRRADVLTIKEAGRPKQGRKPRKATEGTE